jgi:hypothetical protein
LCSPLTAKIGIFEKFLTALPTSSYENREPFSNNLCRFAIVDADDYEHLAKYKWYCEQDGNTFYTFRREGRKRKRVSMHRQILHAPKGLLVDHIDGNGLNNRKSNLRLCSPAQNARNKRPAPNCSSRYKGVTWHKYHKKWHVRIFKSGKSTYLGSFDDEIEAAVAYDRKAAELFGEFAYLNFPTTDYTDPVPRIVEGSIKI